MSTPSSLSPNQEADLKKLQQYSQQINQLLGQIRQFERAAIDIERTLNAIKDLADDRELYRAVGQIYYKANVVSTRKELSEQQELFNVRIGKFKKQMEDMEKAAKELEENLRSSLSLQP